MTPQQQKQMMIEAARRAIRQERAEAELDRLEKKARTLQLVGKICWIVAGTIVAVIIIGIITHSK